MKTNWNFNSFNTHLHITKLKQNETKNKKQPGSQCILVYLSSPVFWLKQAISYMYPENPIEAFYQTRDFVFHHILF